MTPASHTLFIADLHLDASRADTVALALRFLDDARGAGALYILGDLVEYWLGDDAGNAGLDTVFDALSTLSAGGTRLHLLHGNRDFLLGEQFAERIGATLHREDQLMMSLGSVPALLLHGDTLCTDDHEYQDLRHTLRDTSWQRNFLDKTVAERLQEAEALRERSRAAVADKQTGIMDVNADSVCNTFREHHCALMIHGHTHRPADHHVTVDGQRCRRLVVGDWHADHADIARWDGEQLRLQRYPLDGCVA